MADLPKFRYSGSTVQVDDLVLDARALNAFIARAESLYGRKDVTYVFGAEVDPEKTLASNEAVGIDCSGFAFWSCYLKRIWMHSENNPKQEWIKISRPIPGATVRYDPKPGKKSGHSGVIIAPGSTPGNFQTLDSTNADSPPSAGSIKYQSDGKTRWLNKGGPNVRFLVSADAVITRGGKPLGRKLNLLLEAAKHPVVTGGLGLLLVAGLGYFAWRRFRR